ncbi:MAG: hypothetical protein IJ426_01945 [Clostridia bacterium]|nr:hypothetical protein [Clostridia bacterium]
MNKIKLLSALLAIFLLAFCLCSCGGGEEDKLISKYQSPDGEYTLYFYQVGDPQWSFGSVGAKLLLKNSDGKTVDEEEFSLQNDGGNADISNVSAISWSYSSVKVNFIEFDTTNILEFTLDYN